MKKFINGTLLWKTGKAENTVIYNSDTVSIFLKKYILKLISGW